MALSFSDYELLPEARDRISMGSGEDPIRVEHRLIEAFREGKERLYEDTNKGIELVCTTGMGFEQIRWSENALYRGPFQNKAHGLRMKREDVDRLVASAVAQAGKAKPTMAAETRCLRWLEDEMRAHPRPPHPKSHYRAKAKSRFEKLSYRGFERAWANAVAATGVTSWRSPGRKSSQKSPH